MEFSEVRQRIGGLKGVVRLLDAHCLSGDKIIQCPFCKAKRGKAGFFTKDNVDFFKCHAQGCSSFNEVLTEVSYIAAREGLSMDKPSEGPSPAYRRLLELANCWEEPKPKAERKPAPPKPVPSLGVCPHCQEPIKEGQPTEHTHDGLAHTKCTSPEPIESPAPSSPVDDLPEDLVAAAKRLVIAKQSTSVRLLRDNLKVGTQRAMELLEALEKLGVVGPARERAGREVLVKNNLPEQSGVPAEPAERDGSVAPSERNLCEVIEVARLFGSVSVESLEKHTDMDSVEAAALLATLRERGCIDADGKAVKLPEKPHGLMVFKIDDHVTFDWSAVKVKEEKISAAAPVKEEKADPLPVGLACLRYFYDQLAPTDCQMVAFVPGGPLPEPIPNEVLRRIKFKPVSLYDKRGLTPQTCAELGFRANPRRNEILLRSLVEKFPLADRLASGLWLPEDTKRRLPARINTQFCGKGQIGKKVKAERRNQDDEWQWGWSEPLLIPYFDNMGQVIKLRPHKGGGKSNTVAGGERIYVPRRWKTAGDVVEKFSEVVICEGEFKAAAIWQTIGMGADEHFGDEPVGVCALPGISFAKSVIMRDELDEWLTEVDCKRVYVAFDTEDNSHKPMRQRYDVQIYATYLAEDLHRKLHIETRVVTLPDGWRNAKGKADWDGALAKLVQAEAVMDAMPPTEDGPPPEVLDEAVQDWGSPE